MQNTQVPLDEQLERLFERNQDLIDALKNLRKRLGIEESVDEKKVAVVAPEERSVSKEETR